MTWQLLVAIYLILGTVTYLLQRRLGVSLPQHKRLVTGFFFVAVHYPIGLIVAAFYAPNLYIGWLNLGLLLVGSWVFPLINIATLRANKDIDAGLFAVLTNLTPIITIVAASVFLSEGLGPLQIIATITILVSACLATLPGWRFRARKTPGGLAFALLAVVLMGLAVVYERWMLTRIDFGAYLVLGWGAQTLWTGIMAWPQRKQFSVLVNKKQLGPMMWYALSATLKGIAFVGALSLTTNVSLVSACTGLLPVFVVFAAYYVLKEKQWLAYKIVASVLGTAGLILLCFT